MTQGLENGPHRLSGGWEACYPGAMPQCCYRGLAAQADAWSVRILSRVAECCQCVTVEHEQTGWMERNKYLHWKRTFTRPHKHAQKNYVKCKAQAKMIYWNAIFNIISVRYTGHLNTPRDIMSCVVPSPSYNTGSLCGAICVGCLAVKMPISERKSETAHSNKSEQVTFLYKCEDVELKEESKFYLWCSVLWVVTKADVCTWSIFHKQGAA